MRLAFLFPNSGILAIAVLCDGAALAQNPAAPRATPSSLLAPRGTPATASGQPPRDIPLVEKKWDKLGDQEVSGDGKTALAIDPDKWKHAETENFTLHYRRATEAQKVAREVEYDLWFVATALGATTDRYTRKSHVYVFEDDAEWKSFLAQTKAPPWSASFAKGDELFLNVRRSNETGRFNSSTLAHETTHAVVARLYPRKRWPLWLNEGFAEYMGGASVAARKGQTLKRFQGTLQNADMPLSTMEALQSYPADEAAIGALYQSSEKFIRFLMTEFPKDRIAKFIEAMLDDRKAEAAVLEVYGDKIKDWSDFTRRYEKFAR